MLLILIVSFKVCNLNSLFGNRYYNSYKKKTNYDIYCLNVPLRLPVTTGIYLFKICFSNDKLTEKTDGKSEQVLT